MATPTDSCKPQYVDREKSLSRPLPPAAIVEPKKDDNTKGKKLQATKHDGYSALSISAAASNSIRMTRCSLKSGAGVDGSRKRDFKEPSECGRFINTARCKVASTKQAP
ncbi:hypothetical protein Tco_0583511 [Tanacetum coccineum]